MPLHWSGEPFSYHGRTSTPATSSPVPRPVQDPIPVWIGGNSHRTLERVATKAQGWMPLTGSPQLATTARTAYLASLEAVSEQVQRLREVAGARAPFLDIVLAYREPSVLEPDTDVDRHREALSLIEEAGATWVLVPGPAGSTKASLEFIEAFTRNYKQ